MSQLYHQTHTPILRNSNSNFQHRNYNHEIPDIILVFIILSPLIIWGIIEYFKDRKQINEIEKNEMGILNAKNLYLKELDEFINKEIKNKVENISNLTNKNSVKNLVIEKKLDTIFLKEGKGKCDFCQEKKEGITGSIYAYQYCSSYDCMRENLFIINPLICRDCIKQMYNHFKKTKIK